MVAAGQNLAGAVWPPIVRHVTEEHGWRATFLAYGVFTLVTLLPLVPFLKGKAPAATAATAAPGAAPARAAGLPLDVTHFILFLMQVMCCLAMAAAFVHGPAHVSDLGHSMSTGANMLSLVLASSIASLLTLGAIADRIGGLYTLMIASTIQAIALVLYAHFESLSMLYASAVVFGLGFGGLVPSYAIVIREIFPVSQVGWRIASTFLGGTLGMSVGGWLAGRIFDATGHYHDAFVLGFGFNLVNLALAAFLLPGWRRHRQTARAAA
jgi:MFS family permease